MQGASGFAASTPNRCDPGGAQLGMSATVARCPVAPALTLRSSDEPTMPEVRLSPTGSSRIVGSRGATGI